MQDLFILVEGLLHGGLQGLNRVHLFFEALRVADSLQTYIGALEPAQAGPLTLEARGNFIAKGHGRAEILFLFIEQDHQIQGLGKPDDIAFGLDEEESLTLVDVTGRVRAAFDVERATRRFYDRFKRERDAFQSFLEGIPETEMARWYVSVMLNRLMFIYFIQKKGFLDQDQDYLRRNLRRKLSLLSYIFV